MGSDKDNAATDLPFSDAELIEMARKYGARDGASSEGIEADDELEDVADDAWYHSGWMEFENHPQLEEHGSLMADKASALRLSSVYIEAFVKSLE